MAERTSPRSAPLNHVPPPTQWELDEEEAIRQLLEGVDNIEINETSGSNHVESKKDISENSDVTDLAKRLSFAFEEDMRLYRISPNILRSCLGIWSPVRITSGFKLLESNIMCEESVRTQLFQIINLEAVNETILLSTKGDSLITKLLADGDIKKISPEEGAELVKEPFAIIQEDQPRSDNSTILDLLGVKEEHNGYQLMLHDPHLNVEMGVAGCRLSVENPTFMQGQREHLSFLAEKLPFSLQSSEQDMHLSLFKESEEKLREILGKKSAWGSFFLRRREVLIEQYQNRPQKKLSLSRSTRNEILESVQEKYNIRKEIEQLIELYPNNIPLLRCILRSQKEKDIIVREEFIFSILGVSIVNSETGYIRFKNREKWEQMNVCIRELGEWDLSKIQTIMQNFYSIITDGIEPVTKQELDQKKSEVSVLILNQEPVTKSVSILKELNIEESDPLYEVMSKDPYLREEQRLASIGVCTQDRNIKEAILATEETVCKEEKLLEKGFRGEGLKEEIIDAAEKKYLVQKLGGNKERYDRLLVENLKELYRARIEK